MHVTVRLEGINLEKLLREASAEGILLRSVRRVAAREMIVCVRTQDAGQLQAQPRLQAVRMILYLGGERMERGIGGVRSEESQRLMAG